MLLSVCCILIILYLCTLYAIIIHVRTGNVCIKHALYIAEVSVCVVVLCAGGSPLVVPLDNLVPATLYRVSIRPVPITGCVVSRQRVVDFQIP